MKTIQDRNSIARAFLAMILILVATFSACGGKDRMADVRHRLRVAVDRIEHLERVAPAEGIESEALVKKCRKKLDAARGLIIEEDLEGADALIAEVMRMVRPALAGKESLDSKNVAEFSFAEFDGDVRVRSGNDKGWERMDQSTRPAIGMAVHTGIRSSVMFQGYAGGRLHLHDQSEIEIIDASEIDDMLAVRLRKGFVDYEQKNRLGMIKVSLRDYEIQVPRRASVEIGRDSVARMDYVAVHRGHAIWTAPELGNEKLEEDQALILDASGRRVESIPTNPVADTPTTNRVFTVLGEADKAKVRFRWHADTSGLNYQLQVSRSPGFATRVYDRADLVNGASDVDLGRGEYYWRVRAIGTNRVPGAFSPPIKFVVKSSTGATPTAATDKKLKGPPIKKVKIELINNVSIVSGRSHPTAYVTVNGVKAVMGDDGHFSVIVNFVRRGEQWVEIVARDAKGGETVSRHKVKLSF